MSTSGRVLALSHVDALSLSTDSPPKAPLANLKHLNDLSWFLRSLGCGDCLADDLTQDTYVVVLSDKSIDQPPGRSFAYLRGIARNLYLRHLRQRLATVRFEDIEEMEAMWGRLFDRDLLADPIDALQHCMKRLTARTQRALLRRYRDGLDRQELSRELNMTPPALTKMFQRAKCQLRDCIERRLDRMGETRMEHHDQTTVDDTGSRFMDALLARALEDTALADRRRRQIEEAVADRCHATPHPEMGPARCTPRRLMTWFISAAAIMIATVLWVQTRQDEDKSADQEKDGPERFVEQLRSDNSKDVSLAAERLVRMRGTAMPILIEKLSSPTRASSQMQEEILSVLRRIAPEAGAALPAVLKIFSKTGSRRMRTEILKTVDALAPYAPEHGAKIEQWLIQRSRKNHNQAIVGILFKLSLNSDDQTDTLVRALNGSNPFHREVAARLLGKRSAEAEIVLPKLLQALRDSANGHHKQTQLRYDFGDGRSGVMKVGVHSTRERASIAAAIVQIAKPKNVPASAHVHLLWHDDPSMIKRAIEHVAVHRVSEAAVVKRLGVLARTRDPLVAWEAITTLGTIGPDAELAIKMLEGLNYGPDEGRVARAKAALRSLRKR